MVVRQAFQRLGSYACGHITPEMAVGHSLQHIDNLYETQTAARTEWRAEIAALKKQLVQTTVDRLNGIIKKARAKQHAPSNPPKTGQA